MSLAFFYLAPEKWAKEVCLKDQEARHLSQVLRLGPGNEVGLLDGRGRKGRFIVRKAGKKTSSLNASAKSVCHCPKPVR